MSAPSNARSRARSWALNLLYGWEVADSGLTPAAWVEEALARRRMSRRYREHALRLVRTVSDHLAEIDELIARHTVNWRVDRIGVVDRNILRIGIAEIRWLDDVPPRVAIHEALRLATRYGGDDTARFVNGVLDAVFKKEDAPAP